MIFTYNVHKELIFTEVICLYKFWAVIIASRISETWIIKLINGIIEFDQKLTSLPTYLKARLLQRSFSKQCWNLIFICGLLHYIGTSLLVLYLWPILVTDTHSVFTYLIRVSAIVDFTVIISSFFFLRNLEYRFETLIDFWKCLPVQLMAVRGECSNYDIAIMIDNIRLLYTELSDLLRIISLGYGKMLFGYLVFSYNEMLSIFLYKVCFEFKTKYDTLTLAVKMVVPHIGNLQNVILVMTIIVSASRVNEKIIVLIVSGLVTLIQMKEHPYVLHIVNDTIQAFNRRVLMHRRVFFNVSKINNDV